jgi:hypothetical protein
MISIAVLIPALFAIAMLNMQSAVLVARKLYLPVIMFVPLYMAFRIGGLIVVPTTFVTVFIAASGLLNWGPTIRWSFVDVCVAAYALSAFYADFHIHTANIAVYAFIFSLTSWIFPYIVGRTLIEQPGTRFQFAQALVACLTIVAMISFYEFVAKSNPFQLMVEKLQHSSVPNGHQTRFGFERISGPYAHAIVAGMVFTDGLMIQLWLMSTKTWHSTRMLGFLRGRRKPLYITLAMVAGLIMTGSRGPWIGAFFGLIVTSIGFAKNRKRAAMIALSLLIVAGSVTYVVLDKYTDVDVNKAQDADQQNAAYRRDLLLTYMPLIKDGGIFGHGTPMVFNNGMMGYSAHESSIDNEFLRVTLQQGYLGITLFVLILGSTMVHLIRLCVTMRNRDDVIMAYCFLGIMVSTSFTLTTVFLGDPMLQILFLIIGWSQSIRPTRSFANQAPVVRTQQFEFERVFV